MALWNTFTWSDGTLWADANGTLSSRYALIDSRGYHISLRISHTFDASPGSLTSLIILTSSMEVGVRSQLSHDYEAFIDRNQMTQRISAKVHMSASDDTITAPSIDTIVMIANKRSRRQPS